MSAVITRIILPALLLLSLAVPALAEPLSGQCVAAHDGDTITILLNGKKENIRLIGIDAPELAQAPWGPKAGAFVRGLVVGQTVRVETDVQARDKYQRLLGYAYVGDTFVNLEAVRQGYAMVYTYPPNVAHTDEFVAAQREARDKGLNIWDHANGLTQSPSDFRHGKGNRIQRDVQHVKAAKQQATKAQAGAHMVSMNQNSRKYHEAGCRYYGGKNSLELSLADAEAQGGIPCKICH